MTVPSSDPKFWRGYVHASPRFSRGWIHVWPNFVFALTFDELRPEGLVGCWKGDPTVDRNSLHVSGFDCFPAYAVISSTQDFSVLEGEHVPRVCKVFHHQGQWVHSPLCPHVFGEKGLQPLPCLSESRDDQLSGKFVKISSTKQPFFDEVLVHDLSCYRLTQQQPAVPSYDLKFNARDARPEDFLASFGRISRSYAFEIVA
ncbi:unnamed protein product [Schistocephalus solidus]|uniref:Acetoacetate decarboxylase n=1 Tax=Schistocephalus solidus TaxID=70667 RepID=A0A183SBB1_SCHSO|nr:unnamed protein product [Schistocephalus solidus]